MTIAAHHYPEGEGGVGLPTALDMREWTDGRPFPYEVAEPGFELILPGYWPPLTIRDAAGRMLASVGRLPSTPLDHAKPVAPSNMDIKTGLKAPAGQTLMSFDSGYTMDGSSGPAIDTLTVRAAAWAHDLGYQAIREGHWPTHMRRRVDRLYRRIIRAQQLAVRRASSHGRLVKWLWAGASATRRSYHWAGVRLFGGQHAAPK